MKQTFDRDVMSDLADDASTADDVGALEGDDLDEPAEGASDSFEGDGFEEDAFEGDGFEEDAFEGDGFEEDDYEGDGFDGHADGADLDDLDDDNECLECMDAFEYEEADPADDVDQEALALDVAEALDADDGDAFLRRLLAAVSRVSRGVRQTSAQVRRGARAARRGADTVIRAARRGQQVARRVGDVAGSVGSLAARAERVTGRASRAGSALESLRILLRSALGDGTSEADAFEAVTDLFAEGELDAAMPVLGAMVARTAMRSHLRGGARLGGALRRGVVRSAIHASRSLIRRRGPAAAKTLPRLARSVGRVVARRRISPSAVPAMLRRAAARAAAHPARSRGHVCGAAASRVASGRGVRRLVLQGPVEIVIRPRR